MQRGRDGSGTPRRRKGSSPPGQCPQEHSALQDDTGDARGKRWGRGWFRILLVSLKRNSEGKKKRKENNRKPQRSPPLNISGAEVWGLGVGFFCFFVCLFCVCFFLCFLFFKSVFQNYF